MNALNPTNEFDKKAAVAAARQFAPGLVEDYQQMIRENGLHSLLEVVMAGDGYKNASGEEKMLQLATIMGAFDEMTSSN